jgi:histidinol-phosphate aminotransferase
MKTVTPPQHIQTLKPYQAGKSVAEIKELLGLERVIKLASNENPLGASPKAVASMKKAAEDVSVYPVCGKALREKLAKKLNKKPENIIAGSGSESVLLTAMRTFLEPGDEVVTAEGTFVGFYVCANAMKLNMVTVPLLKDYSFDLEEIGEAISNDTKMVYLANPNNPTGTAFSRPDFKIFLQRLPEDILVIVDEAYFEYATDFWDMYPDTTDDQHPQVLTLRTFSKAYGLAGARIGYGIGHEDVIASMMKVKLPFEPPLMSEAAGLGALDDDEFLQKTLKTNREGMKRLHDVLDEMGIVHTNSVANFTLLPMDSPEAAAKFSDDLLHEGIIARPMVPFRIPHAVRITIGSPDEMDVLITAVKKILG